ncbi:MAG: hypothetical protein M1820_004715 [Bogoriella megaspora]|nr:MAG: hypothetical protein M1820_004715 [Bogoriella megaspora]
MPCGAPPSQWEADLYSQRVAILPNGAKAIGLPSTGGVLIKSVNAVDLIHLDVSRKMSTMRPNPHISSEEDEWCAKLRSLAPTWYRSLRDWENAEVGDRLLKTDAEKQETFVGYSVAPNSKSILVIRSPNGLMPDGFGAYRMCFTMQERCEVMERFGAIGYDTKDEVDELNGRFEQRTKRERDELGEEWGPGPFS